MKKLLYLLMISISLVGCQKYLDEKPNKALALPSDNIENLKLLLSDTYTMNQNSASAGEIASDNFSFTDAGYNRLLQSSPTSANLYAWNTNLFNENDRNDWTYTYNAVLNTNLVLDALATLKRTSENQQEWDNVKGQALFFRAWEFFSLLQEFAKAYNASTSATDPGIALRLKSDINIPSTRASVKRCVDQISQDLLSALPLLPANPDYKTSPGKLAGLGLLARFYLYTGDYNQALNYANQYLSLSPALMDYNTIPVSGGPPFSRYNDEVGFHTTLFQWQGFSAAYGRVSDSLFAQYDVNDLRRALFFKNGGAGNITFIGSYDGSRAPFGGIATDEIYLIAAESYARTGNINNAMDMLNSLLSKRWLSGTFVALTASDQDAALNLILSERRKELVYRNLRWGDLKRLNEEGKYTHTLTRNVLGQSYTLAPGDSRYELKLPAKVIELSGMQQN